MIQYLSGEMSTTFGIEHITYIVLAIVFTIIAIKVK
jgi:hypothetical protein